MGVTVLCMRPMLVNTKQKIAVLASGLAIATTGLVTDAQASSSTEGPVTGPDQSAAATLSPPADKAR
jgi:hypothetical protein